VLEILRRINATLLFSENDISVDKEGVNLRWLYSVVVIKLQKGKCEKILIVVLPCILISSKPFLPTNALFIKT
jgi:hypothetical protein